MLVIEFENLDTACTWRRGNGGWLFVPDTGEHVWGFAPSFTPTPILLHPTLRGMNGKLV